MGTATITQKRFRALLVVVGAAAVTLSPGRARAQTVLGRVLERGGGGPVAGAMVRLQAAGPAARAGDAPAGAGWLTGPDGRFRLQAPAGGAFQIHVARIGFQETVVTGVEVADGGIASIDVVVETQPIELGGLEVAARGGRCERDVQGGSVAQVVWDEARKALTAQSWTQSRSGLRFVVTVWDRQISSRTSQILSEETSQRETVGANSVQSLPPQRLLAEGYVRTDPSFSYYYAPDAQALLSDEFQDTHCFRVVDGEDGSPFIGLEFEPDDDRRLPDVAGVIWVDRVSGRLDRVDFRYTGLDVSGASRARGQVRFAELESGQWIVRDWFIQAPMGRGRIGGAGVLRGAEPGQIHEVGNAVEVVEGPGILWRPDTAPGVVRGTVFDSISGQPFAGAIVRVGGRNLRAAAGLDGRFELRGLGPGLHRVTFDHTRLDSLGVAAGWITVDLEPGGVIDLELAIPPWTTLLARTCEASGAGALVGFVYSRSGAPVGGATVAIVGSAADPGQSLTTRSDSRGGYVLCGVPMGVVRLSARLGSAASEVVEARVDSTRFTRADVTIRPGVVVAAVPGALRPAIVGTVMAHDTRRPLEGVAVTLLAIDGDPLASTITDEEGRFAAVLDEGAEVFLRISRLGYTGAVSEALSLDEGTRRVEVFLPEEAIEIDPVIVVVDTRSPYLERVGFYDRAVTHPGAFIQRDDVDAVSPARTSDLLGRVPGVRVTNESSGGLLRRRVLYNRLALLGGDLCYPAVFVDDELVRIGGSRTESQWPVVQGVEPPAGEDVPSIDELVPPHEIAAVEMYENAARLPPRFIGLGTHCGVVVIWTTRAR
jgi:hypothetical protein